MNQEKLTACVKMVCLFFSMFFMGQNWCVAQETPQTFSESHPFLLRYIRQHMPCTNPEVVAEAILHVIFVDDNLLEHPDTEVRMQDLGDDTQGYIFLFPGGGGQWAMYQPSVHCVIHEHVAKILFVGKSRPTEYLTTYPTRNGRYEIAQWWRVMRLETDENPLVWNHRRWFWDGTQYQEAYTETSYQRYGMNNVGTINVQSLRVWNPDEKVEYKNAPRTWKYTIQPDDTLVELCAEMELNMTQILEQNHLERPDQITVGQTLTYTSE